MKVQCKLLTSGSYFLLNDRRYKFTNTRVISDDTYSLVNGANLKNILESYVTPLVGVPIIFPSFTMWANSKGEFHRLDGPAREWINGDIEWFVNGYKYDSEFEYWLVVQNYDKR